MYLKNLKAIIPALGRNRYSKHGDLESFGDTNLLEWKIYQIKKIIPKNQIFVTAFELNIKEICNSAENELKDLELMKRNLKKEFKYIDNELEQFELLPKLINDVNETLKQQILQAKLYHYLDCSRFEK